MREISRPIKFQVFQGVLIGLNHTVKAVALRVEYVTIDSEAMRGAIDARVQLASKAKQGNLLVRVVVLKNLADRFNCTQVFIFGQVEVVERISVIRVSIRKRIIHCNCERNFATAKNVF